MSKWMDVEGRGETGRVVLIIITMTDEHREVSTIRENGAE